MTDEPATGYAARVAVEIDRLFVGAMAAGLTAAGIQAMAPGPAREAIEAETNVRAAAPYAALTATERRDLLDDLSALGR
ncbi:MAG TPA: hypothetical protein VFB84_04470 [Micromonosporaceae bacterium]|nr:hypothetical protein [Micromonosporaceae bacterium]